MAGCRRLRAVSQGDVKARIGGDMQKITVLEVSHSDDAYTLMLVPIWRDDLGFLSRVDREHINGRTGKIVGERPCCTWKIALAVPAGLALVLAIAAIIVVMPDGP